MIPQYEILLHGQDRRRLFRISFAKFAVFVVCLPLCGFLFCVLWSLIFFFQRSTATHCDVMNFLPSISAAIGGYYPQRLVWQICVCLHFLPRLLVAKMNLNFYASVLSNKMRTFVRLAFALNVLEIFALLGLSIYTSVDNYEKHKICFVAFIGASEAYMLISCCLMSRMRKSNVLSKLEVTSIKLKTIFFLVNISCTLGAGYCFDRHNRFCEPGVYSIFAFLEYIVVLSNMGFHTTAYYDFPNKILVLDLSSAFPKIIV